MKKCEEINIGKVRCFLGSKDTKLDYRHLPSQAVYPILNHTSKVAVINGKAHEIEPWTLEADGLVTSTPGVILAVGTADCAPIAFIDKEKPIIGLAHVGWVGAKDGIITNTLLEMFKLGSSISTVKAIIGPSLNQESFEVMDDLVAHFCDINSKNKLSGENKGFFTKKDDTHRNFDFKAFCVEQLQKCGLTDIEVSKEDTFINENYHSLRRRQYIGTKIVSPTYGRYNNLNTLQIS